MSRAAARRSPIASARLNRLFAADGRCLDVALDHGFFGERSFLTGIEDLERAVQTLVQAGPDAIQLSPGQAPVLQRLPGPGKPALVLRTDVANVYGQSPPRTLWSELVEDAVERAVRLDAACVVVNLLSLPGEPELHRQCVRNASTLRAACEQFGMPLMVEPLAMKPSEAGYGVNGDADTIVTLVRQAVELGADVVKADPTDELDEYGRVVEAAADRRYGRVLEVRSAFLHSSDLDPEKPINWKRRAAENGEYGVMGDLGMHARTCRCGPAGSRATCARFSPTSFASVRTAGAGRLPATRGTTPSCSAR